MLWLLRHAVAADGSPDEQRPLTDQGVIDARAAGIALHRLGVKIDVCLSSPKRRALQTAELACEPLGVEVVTMRELAGGPFDPEALLPGVDNLLLVGHDPSFSLALHAATGAQARFSKGGLAAIKKGELLVLMRPAQIHAIAGVTEPVT